MTGRKFKGYLDRLNENLLILDEAIANAQKMSAPGRKGVEKAAALQWAKVLRDLVQERNTTLLNIKSHLLGRDETGATKEPDDIFDGNPQVEYERYFSRLLSPWTQQDLKLKCTDCKVKNEEVSAHIFSGQQVDLCSACYEKRKRTANDTHQPKQDSEASAVDSILKECGETQGEENATSTMSKAVTGIVQNTIRAIALEAHSPLEKVKELEEFKADLIRTAYTHGSGDNIEPGVALLDKEIERLRAEAGKGQDAEGKPAT